MIILHSHSEAGTQKLGEKLGACLLPGDTVLLTGDLGAGKTQLTKGIAQTLGVDEPVTSPTFPILSLHHGREVDLAHFDLYRLEDPSMLDDVGYWEIIEGPEISVVEWGDKFPDAPPLDYLLVNFVITGNTARELHLTPVGPRAQELATQWVEPAGTSGAGA